MHIRVQAQVEVLPIQCYINNDKIMNYTQVINIITIVS